MLEFQHPSLANQLLCHGKCQFAPETHSFAPEIHSIECHNFLWCNLTAFRSFLNNNNLSG